MRQNPVEKHKPSVEEVKVGPLSSSLTTQVSSVQVDSSHIAPAPPPLPQASTRVKLPVDAQASLMEAISKGTALKNVEDQKLDDTQVNSPKDQQRAMINELAVRLGARKENSGEPAVKLDSPVASKFAEDSTLFEQAREQELARQARAEKAESQRLAQAAATKAVEKTVIQPNPSRLNLKPGEIPPASPPLPQASTSVKLPVDAQASLMEAISKGTALKNVEDQKLDDTQVNSPKDQQRAMINELAVRLGARKENSGEPAVKLDSPVASKFAEDSTLFEQAREQELARQARAEKAESQRLAQAAATKAVEKTVIQPNPSRLNLKPGEIPPAPPPLPQASTRVKLPVDAQASLMEAIRKGTALKNVEDQKLDDTQVNSPKDQQRAMINELAVRLGARKENSGEPAVKLDSPVASKFAEDSTLFEQAREQELARQARAEKAESQRLAQAAATKAVEKTVIQPNPSRLNLKPGEIPPAPPPPPPGLLQQGFQRVLSHMSCQESFNLVMIYKTISRIQ